MKNTAVPLHMLTQGDRRILLGRDNDAGVTLVVMRDHRGYSLRFIPENEPEDLRAILRATPPPYALSLGK
jgi:hypothetical protein